MLHLPADLKLSVYQTFVRGQIAVSVQGEDGTLRYATGVQDAGVLDDLYAYKGRLGVVVKGNPAGRGHRRPAPKMLPGREDQGVAPTAQSMKLQLFTGETDTTPASVAAMTERNGLWVAAIDPKWISHYYLFDEVVYAPSTRSVVENFVTDPYSIDLALNGTKSRITDVDAAANTPAGWEGDVAPALDRLNDLAFMSCMCAISRWATAPCPRRTRGRIWLLPTPSLTA